MEALRRGSCSATRDVAKDVRVAIDHFPVQGVYPTTEWQPGEYIRDTFEVEVPHDYPHDYFYLWNGWYIGQERIPLENNVPNDGDGSSKTR